MSKVVAIGAAVVGTGGLCAGGYYLITNKGGTGNATEDTQKPQEPTLINSLDEFKKQYQKEKCVKDLFGSEAIDFSQPATNPTDITDASNFFGNAPADDAEGQTKGCLMIGYEKKAVESNKGTGTFVGLWTFINKDKGFINFNVAKKSDEQKLTLSGGFYLLEKKTTETPNKGTITGKEEVNDNSKTITDLKTQFPKKSTSGKVNIDNKEYWGFGSDAGDLSTSETPKNFPATRGNWTWKKDDTDEISKWSENGKGWWEHVYTSTKEKFKLEEKLATFKGTGSQQAN